MTCLEVRVRKKVRTRVTQPPQGKNPRHHQPPSPTHPAHCHLRGGATSPSYQPISPPPEGATSPSYSPTSPFGRYSPTSPNGRQGQCCMCGTPMCRDYTPTSQTDSTDSTDSPDALDEGYDREGEQGRDLPSPIYITDEEEEADMDTGGRGN